MPCGRFPMSSNASQQTPRQLDSWQLPRWAQRRRSVTPIPTVDAPLQSEIRQRVGLRSYGAVPLPARSARSRLCAYLLDRNTRCVGDSTHRVYRVEGSLCAQISELQSADASLQERVRLSVLRADPHALVRQHDALRPSSVGSLVRLDPHQPAPFPVLHFDAHAG